LVIVPTGGFKDHVTSVFEVPLTVGVKVVLWPPFSDTPDGNKLRLTVCTGGEAGLETGCNVRETVALLLGSAALLAVINMVSWEVMLEGAV
jgi:hypothetical protein